MGGAIYNNDATIGNITGDFVGNYALGEFAYCGAIYNDGTIGDITGDFIGNWASGYYTCGGALYNSGTVGDITGDFIGNYASGYYVFGGVIYNYHGTIGDITGDFIGNWSSSSTTDEYCGVYGGAIYNYYGTIGNITGDFTGNYVGSCGGAVYNEGNLKLNIVPDGKAETYETISDFVVAKNEIDAKFNSLILANRALCYHTITI